MSHDGLPVRAPFGAREAAADRRTGVLAIAGLTFTLALAACGGTSSSGGVAGATGTPLASTAASAESSAESSATASGSGMAKAFLTFQAQNASKVSGGGSIIDLGDGSVAVTLGLVAIGFDEPMPARLVSGACTDAASAPAPSYVPPPPSPSAGASGAAASAEPSMEASPSASAAESGSPAPATLPVELTPVSAGASNTVVQLQLATLLSSPSSVLVYKSQAEPQLVACADVSPTLVIPSSAPAASAAASEAPMSSAEASGSTAP